MKINGLAHGKSLRVSAILCSSLSFALNLLVHFDESRLNPGYYSFADYIQESGKD
ncbi:exported protein of unknown function [Legionella pneumophila subsp. pneumophila]|nr:exported protein of unknown function [Legionella pneumophila subsp. pneumophila]